MSERNLTEFIRLVREMREAQRGYAMVSMQPGRSRVKALDRAVTLERAVDTALKRLSQRTGPTLFDSESITERGEE